MQTRKYPTNTLRLSRTITAAGLAMLLAACASNMQKLDRSTSTGSAFTSGLAQGYKDFAHSESEEYDWQNVSFFAAKGSRAAEGHNVAPEQAADWRDISPDNRVVLDQQRTRLVAAMENGARERWPADAAAAQVAYDCLVEEMSEPNSEGDRERCRGIMDSAIGRMKVTQRTSEVVAPPPTVPAASVYLVFFAFDRSEISAVSERVLETVMADFRKTGLTQIDIQGYTDLSGTVGYNEGLSERRAQAVRQYFLTHSVQDAEIRTEWFGKTHPRVATADGVRNQENRRDEIYLQK